jgi:chitinase
VSAAVTAGTTYTMKLPSLSGSCLDINGAGTGDGTNVQEWSCNGTGAQVWRTDDGGASGYYKLVNPNSNKCLDVSGNGTADGTNIQLWTCNGSAAQDFQFVSINGYYKIVGRNSGKCVDVNGANSANGTNVQLWACNGSGAQNWNPSSTVSGPAAGCNYSTWASGHNYNPGDVVQYSANGNYYQCTNANPGYDPTVSTWFWSPYTCGVGAPPPPQPPPSGTNGIAGVVSQSQFESQMFPNRNSFYTYNGLISTSSAYAAFANQGDTTLRKREAAAFLANMAHETGAPLNDTEVLHGLVYTVEQNTANYCSYCDTGRSYGCPAGSCNYYGRGPIQLSWNFNYYAAGQSFGSDLLNNPGLVSSDASVSWKSASWYWMTQPGPGGAGNSAHDGISTGFGETIRHINGSIECGQPQGSYAWTQMHHRVLYYEYFCNQLGVSYGSDESC